MKAGKGSLTVKAKTEASKTGGSAWQIQYRIKGTSRWKTFNTKKQTVSIRNLKKGRNYQVRIRAFRKAEQKTFYGAWSKIKSCKTKR